MKQNFFKFIADLRFAIFILLLISLCSIIGTIIEQDQPIEAYKINYPLTQQLVGILSWDKILFFGFDHVFKTWWFFSLIIIFGMSLIICTLVQQIPAIKIARRCQFFRTVNPFSKIKISTILNPKKFTKIISKLNFKKYSLFQQKNILYCYKGLIGRLAPVIVHFSMILILSGTLIGSFGGFKAQEIIPKTELFHIQNIFNNGLLTKIPNFSGRVNDFWITYTKQKTISQFYSDISILDINGTEITRKTNFVNSPIIYNNIYCYQTDWNLIAIRFKDTTKQIIEYPLINLVDTKTKLWLTWIPNISTLNDGVIVIIDNLQGYCSLYDSTGFFIGNFEVNEKKTHQNNIAFVDILSSTGLQIKTDPGIPVIYIGFLFLMISTLISYISYSQVWIVQKNNQIFIGGTTSRAIFEFELEFFNILK